MKILVLGNPDVEMDNRAIIVAKRLKNFPGVKFAFINPNEDLPPEKFLTLIDTVVGLPEVTLLTEKELKKVRIIGLPAEGAQ